MFTAVLGMNISCFFRFPLLSVIAVVLFDPPHMPQQLLL